MIIPSVMVIATSLAFAASTPPADDDSPSQADAFHPEPSAPPRITPAPVVKSLARLQEAERTRVSLPARTFRLDDALLVLGQLGELRIDADWAALETIGIVRNETVDVDARPGSIMIVLEQVLAAIGGGYERPVVDGTPDGLRVTARATTAGSGGPLLHPVADLIASTPLLAADAEAPTRFADTDELADLIRDVVARDDWYEVGGSIGRIRIRPDALLVVAPAFIQLEVARLLETLRIQRPDRVECSISIVRMPIAAVERIRLAHPPDSPTAIAAIRRASEAASRFEALADLVPGRRTSLSAAHDDVEITLELDPRWDPAGHVLRCGIRGTFSMTESDAVDERTIETDLELRLPAAGIVVVLPATGSQSPLSLLITTRAR